MLIRIVVLNSLPVFSLQETIAMTRLKRDLLQVTGNVNFYKSGGLYVVFRTDTGSQQAAHSLVERRSRTKKNTSKA